MSLLADRGILVTYKMPVSIQAIFLQNLYWNDETVYPFLIKQEDGESNGY